MQLEYPASQEFDNSGGILSSGSLSGTWYETEVFGNAEPGLAGESSLNARNPMPEVKPSRTSNRNIVRGATTISGSPIASNQISVLLNWRMVRPLASQCWGEPNQCSIHFETSHSTDFKVPQTWGIEGAMQDLDWHPSDLNSAMPNLRRGRAVLSGKWFDRKPATHPL